MESWSSPAFQRRGSGQEWAPCKGRLNLSLGDVSWIRCPSGTRSASRCHPASELAGYCRWSLRDRDERLRHSCLHITWVSSAVPVFPSRRLPERSRSSGAAKDLPLRNACREIPRPAGENAGLRDDAMKTHSSGSPWMPTCSAGSAASADTRPASTPFCAPTWKRTSRLSFVILSEKVQWDSFRLSPFSHSSSTPMPGLRSKLCLSNFTI